VVEKEDTRTKASKTGDPPSILVTPPQILSMMFALNVIAFLWGEEWTRIVMMMMTMTMMTTMIIC
jgi:hypothetical protein